MQNKMAAISTARDFSRNRCRNRKVYVHTDPNLGYNLRFDQPIETTLDPDSRAKTVGFALNGDWNDIYGWQA